MRFLEKTCKVHRKFHRENLLGSLCIYPLFFAILFTSPSKVVYGDQWTGAGEISAAQVRDWNIPGNWLNGVVPPLNDTNFFNQLGDGQINLNGPQWAGGMVIADFSNPLFAVGAIPSSLTFTQDPGLISVFEGVRDTYGANYFTEGPEFAVPIIFQQLLQIDLGVPGAPTSPGAKSALLLSGTISALGANPTIKYTGYGPGTSLWISSYNDYSQTGGMTVMVVDSMTAPAFNGIGLDLADSARLDGATVELYAPTCQFGMHDNTIGANSNWYFTTVDCKENGTIFTDRSYQLNDMDATINAVQWLPNVIVRGGNAFVNFGSTASMTVSGRTNNGFSQCVQNMFFPVDNPEMMGVLVHNGNLTENRGGSRYVSGANRLQEAHNYVNVENLTIPTTTFQKGGTGVLWVRYVNGGGAWPVAPNVNAGVLRLGDPGNPPVPPGWPPNPHTMPLGPGLQLSMDAGVGIAWDTTINLPLSAPFAIQPAATLTPGQCGAVDVDLWNFGWTTAGPPTIDTNFYDSAARQWTYLRVGSSMGGDASFDPQPLPWKHASVVFQDQQGLLTQIVPYNNNLQGPFIYYFGGGGGTLRVDTQLNDFTIEQDPIPTDFEMGTTGTLLPGRVALNPGLEDNPDEPNLYTGRTLIRAGTLQLMKINSVYGTSLVSLGTYDQTISQALYKNPAPPAAWEGPGQLLLDPTAGGNWNLYWYQARYNGLFSQPLFNALMLDGGVIGWTGNVTIPGVPGQYGATVISDLVVAGQTVNVLGLGGEYSAGTMTTTFNITDNLPYETPVLLYKAGKNSTLDLRQTPGGNTYTGGTIIAGGTIVIDSAAQLNAIEGSPDGQPPIAILNGGRLRIAPMQPMPLDVYLDAPIKINTDGTPDTVKNCGSVIEVADQVNTWLGRPFDFAWNPGAYLEKDGKGTLRYESLFPPNLGSANAWGLKLTAGMTIVNQMPVNPGVGDSGPVIFNDGDLTVRPVPAGLGIPDTDPAYGFRCLVSMQTTSSTVYIEDDALFRTHGAVPNEILGTVSFIGQDMDGIQGNNFVHLSRNMAPAAAQMPADMSRGDGALVLQDVTVYMSSGGGMAAGLNVLPQEAGFNLILNDGTTFYGSSQNPVFGEVNFNNLNTANPVRIDGAEASPTPSPFPYSFTLIQQTWSILGTGYTAWSGLTEKIDTGTVEFNRQQGAAVSVNSSTLLRIVDGTLVAKGMADPFTDTTTNFSLDIENNSQSDGSGIGLEISEGAKKVDVIFGTGDTWVWDGGSGTTTLTATSITQNSLNIGIMPPPHAAAASMPVPEPSTWLLLALAVFAGMIYKYGKR
ncbi:MAG: hypothetical protein JXB10_15400 [Pirellulales bacterium]|nr:hypothetical protein [Pirellulales bacterium]